MMPFFFVILIALCWGSFLNVVAHRLVTGTSFWAARSFCPSCDRTLAWYDMIPLLSWIALRARCRWCSAPISPLYPFIELLSGVVFTALYMMYFGYEGLYSAAQFSSHMLAPFCVAALFFSALIINVRTDLQGLVVFDFFTLWLIPFGLLAAWGGLAPVTQFESALGIFFGIAVLWIVKRLFFYFTKRNGLGQGDIYLLGFIGSFLGPIGVWFSVLAGSTLGLLLGGGYLLLTGQGRSTRIPFVPFLAAGATLYFFFADVVEFYLL